MKVSAAKSQLGGAISRDVVVGDDSDPDNCLRARVQLIGLGPVVQRAMEESAEIAQEGSPEDATAVVLDALAQVVSSWDLADEDGPIPPLVSAMTGKVDLETALVLLISLTQAVSGAPFETASSES